MPFIVSWDLPHSNRPLIGQSITNQSKYDLILYKMTSPLDMMKQKMDHITNRMVMVKPVWNLAVSENFKTKNFFNRMECT